MKCVIFTFLVIVIVAMAAVQGAEECIPWTKTPCQTSEDCCRHLICMGAMAKCVPAPGLIVPGKDKRPLGPGPYPPNVPKNELPQ